MTLKEWFEYWQKNCVKGYVKAHTESEYREIVRLHILPKLGEKEVGEITALQVQEFLNEKYNSGSIRTKNGLSASTVNLIFAVLKRALDDAVKFGVSEKNPCGRVQRIKGEERRIEVFTDRERRRIEAEALRRGGEYLGIVIALHTGLRLGELLALEWRDVNFRNRTIRVNKTVCKMKGEEGYRVHIDSPKTRASARIIPITAETCVLLREERKKSKSRYVITSGKDEPHSVRGYQHKFERMLKGLKIARRGFHALRHTFATAAVESGADIKNISEIMGHENTQITLNRYVHGTLSGKRRAILRMEKGMRREALYQTRLKM